MKKLLLNMLLLLLFCITMQAQESNDIYISEPPIPFFPGGELKKYEFIEERLYYPQVAIDQNIEGRCIMRFLVRTTGELDSIKVLRGIHPACDNVALNIVKAMPNWEWGENDKNIRETYFFLPIIFRLTPKNDNQPHWKSDEAPCFPGGKKSMKKFISDNLRYPQKDISLEGEVLVRFIVTKKGKIKDPVIVKNLNPYADKEALRIISLMPDWIPGKINEEEVDVYYTLAIRYGTDSSNDIIGETTIEKNSTKELLLIEKMPEFPGGQEEMFDYIERNLRYPLGDVCVQGRVIVRFVVTKEGKITKAEVLRGIHPAFDKEAIRVIESMPDWIPGMQNGKNIDIYYAVPVKFRP